MNNYAIWLGLLVLLKLNGTISTYQLILLLLLLFSQGSNSNGLLSVIRSYLSNNCSCNSCPCGASG